MCDTTTTNKHWKDLADLALVTPILNTNPGPQYQAANMNYGMTIGIERTPGGRIWACWVGGGDSDQAFMAMRSSDDDGRTWSPTRVVIDPHQPGLPIARRSLVSVLWTDPLGRLWFFFDQSMCKFDGRGGNWATRCDNPDSANPTWTTPVRLWHGCSLIKPIVTRAGEWLLPLSLWDRGKIINPVWKEAFLDLDPLRGVNFLASTDNGETWTYRGGAVAVPHPDFDEPNVVERADGSLWLTIRTMDQNVWESVSTDGGRSWTPPVESAIKHVNSRHFMRRLASGRLLLIKHGREVNINTTRGKIYTGRQEMTAFLSEDDGSTWIGGLTFDEREPVTYPDGFQAPDGTIYISYDHARETLGQVLFAKFREEDILSRKVVSADARLKQLIFEPGKKR